MLLSHEWGGLHDVHHWPSIGAVLSSVVEQAVWRGSLSEREGAVHTRVHVLYKIMECVCYSECNACCCLCTCYIVHV